jgi:hypothetical protein
MADLWSVALGGVIGVAGTVATAFINQYGRRSALRAAFRAEISALLSITEARKHEEFAEAIIARWRTGEDVNPTYFGVENGIPRDPVFDANVGKIGEVGTTFAARIGEFYMGMSAVRITMKAVSDGKMKEYPPSIRADLLQGDLAIWRRTKSIGESLVREL